VKCPKCQHELPEDANFCMNCGYNLKSQKQIAAIDLNRPHSYTPKFLADQILTNRSAMEGERKRVTVLFADVANYTAMAEKLDPEEIHQIMDGCFTILMNEIHKHQGTINQFTGDGVMALFGAPVALENHAQNACRAALSIQNTLQKFSSDLKGKTGLEFKMRIGLNSGPVIVGSIGDDLRMDYTAIGDTTNLAARMESMATPCTILVSHNTYKRVAKQFEFKALGKLEIKGKENALEAYELLKDKIDRPRLGLERQIFSEMVGREKELNKLELQINKAIAGEGSVVNVIGEAGIGKSRLISELRASTAMKRATVLEGRAISSGKDLSFHPIINLLKNWARISDEDTQSAAAAKLETAIRHICPEYANEIFPFIATLMGMKLSGRHADRIKGIAGEALEKLIFKNMRDLLIKSTEQTTIAIVTEDLHWADTSSIELLESLYTLSETQPIVFINVFRPNHPETSDRIINHIKNKPSLYHVEIQLQPLTEKMSETLINNMLNIKGLSHTIIDQIIERSGGNPFFIEEVVRSFIDNGAVVKTNGEFKATPKIENMVIPYTINDVLMARIDRLDENSRELIKTASVIGRNFFYRILVEVAKSIEDIDKRLAYLKEIELIRERQRMEELEFLFKHALAQEAAYASILQQNRKHLHLQVARSIEKVFEERIHEFYGMLALHYIKGEEYGKAEEYLIKAGEEALRISASSEALNYYQEGLKLYLQANKDAADPEKLAMFEKNIGIALFNKCRWAEAVAHFDKVFVYWNIKPYPNKAVFLILLAQNVISIATGLAIYRNKRKPQANQRNEEIFYLDYLRGEALFLYDTMRFILFATIAFRRASKVNLATSPQATIIFMGTSAIFTFGLKMPKLYMKTISLGDSILNTKSIKYIIHHKDHVTLSHHCSGNWTEIEILEESIIERALQLGELWDLVSHLWSFTLVKSEQGDFLTVETTIQKISEISKNYYYDYADVVTGILKADLQLKRMQINEAQQVSEHGAKFSSKHSSELHQLMFIGYGLEASIFTKDKEKIEAAVRRGEQIIKQKKFITPLFIAPYLVARFAVDIQNLKQSVKINDQLNLSKLQKQAYKSGRKAFRNSKTYAPYRTKILKLMGQYYWLTNRKKRAFKYWRKAIQTGEKLNARPDLSRTYFEVGKSLMAPESRYKELNGITAQEYLKKARIMFEEMELQWDLDELERVMAAS